MASFGIFNEKDIDGRWFKFAHQQMGNSCTIASIKIAKEFSTNSLIGEAALRGIATLFEKHVAHKGIPMLHPAVAAAHNWELNGGYAELSLKVLKASPSPIATAKIVLPSPDLLRKATRNHPVLIGWSWDSGGGHCTVCIGPTKTEKDLVVILDPGFGLQYVNLDDCIGKLLIYKPIDKKTGNIANTGKHKPNNTFITTA